MMISFVLQREEAIYTKIDVILNQYMAPIVNYQSDLVYSVMIDFLAMEQCSVYSVDMPCSQAVVYVLYGV